MELELNILSPLFFWSLDIKHRAAYVKNIYTNSKPEIFYEQRTGKKKSG